MVKKNNKLDNKENKDDNTANNDDKIKQESNEQQFLESDNNDAKDQANKQTKAEQSTDEPQSESKADKRSQPSKNNDTKKNKSKKQDNNASNKMGKNDKPPSSASELQQENKQANVKEKQQEVDFKVKLPGATLQGKTDAPTKQIDYTQYKYDLKSLEVFKQFELTNKIDSYVEYVGGAVRFESNYPHASKQGMAFYNSSVSLFCPWRVNVRLTLNKEFFKTKSSKVLFVNSVPFNKEGVQDIGMISAELGYTRYFNGILTVLLQIINDNRILHKVDMVTLTEVSTRNVPNFRTVAVPDPKPSLFLASRFTAISWFKRLRDGIMEDSNVTYTYGRTRQVNDVIVNVKTMDIVACNTDHYYASIMNINARHLVMDDDINQRMADLLEAYTFHGVTTNFGQLTKLTPYSCYDPATMTRVISMCAFIDMSFTHKILTDNIEYFEMANIFSYEDKFRLLNTPNETASSRTLIEYLTTRAESTEYSDIVRLMAMEISPIFIVCVHENSPRITNVEMAVVALIEIFLFQITFPNTFERIKGAVQDIQCFMKLCPEEVTKFKQVRGLLYTIDENGEHHYRTNSTEKFRNSIHYLAPVYPSLFSDLTGVGVTHMCKLMELMRPIGELVRDDSAINAQFPRLSQNPEHYIPFKYVEGGQTSDLSEAIRVFLFHLKALVQHYRGSAQVSRSNPTVVSAIDFITGICDYFVEFDVTSSTLCYVRPSPYQD